MTRRRTKMDWLEDLMRDAVERNASAAFLVAGEPPAYRVAGRIARGDGDPLSGAALQRMAAEVLARGDLARLGRKSAIEGARVRLSDEISAVVSVAKCGGIPTIVAMPVQSALLDVRRLALPCEVVSAVQAKSGLVLVTGPTGCGKTTTCYALLEHLNATRDAHLALAVYVEEHALEPKRALITQRVVGTDAPDMVSALGASLSQDPDVLFAGEVRDLETIGACTSAAETGHLVLTQLHQPTPAAAIRRVVDLHPPEVQAALRDSLSRTLRCVLTQRLLPRADGRGQVAAYGWMEVDEAVRAVIASGDLKTLDAVGPPTQRTWEESAHELRTAGVASSPAM